MSDMTVLKPWIFYLELTLYFDVDIVELLRGKKEPTIIHTDQGSVYSSKAYNELIQDRAQVAVFHSFHSRSKA
mgnify:FL=1